MNDLEIPTTKYALQLLGHDKQFDFLFIVTNVRITSVGLEASYLGNLYIHKNKSEFFEHEPRKLICNGQFLLEEWLG